MNVICIGGYPDLVGHVFKAYFDSLCEIDGVDERIYRADPPIFSGSQERYFREKHLSFLPPESDSENDMTLAELRQIRADLQAGLLESK